MSSIPNSTVIAKNEDESDVPQDVDEFGGGTSDKLDSLVYQ